MRRLLILCFLVFASLASRAVAPLWQYNCPSPILFEPTIGGDGTAYFATLDGKLRSLTPSGTPGFTVNPGAVLTTPIAAQNGMLFFGTGDQALRAYGADGHAVWKVRLDSNITNTLAVSADGKIFFGTLNGDVYAVGANQGTVLWKFHAGYALGPPAIGHDGTVYLAADNYFYALDPASGTALWHNNFFNFSKVPIVLDQYDNIFYNRGGILDVYDYRGQFLWESRDASGSLLLIQNVAPVVYGNLLIAAGQGGSDIYAFDSQTGAIEWQFSTANTGTFSPSAIHSMALDGGGTVYFSDGSGVFAWFDATTGAFGGFMPSMGTGGDVGLVGVGLKGRAYVRTGPNSASIVAYKVDGGAGAGPWGQSGGSSRHLYRRDDPPDIQLLSPLDGANVSGSFTAVASASDDFGLATLSLYLNDDQVIQSNVGGLSWGANSALFQDGDYTITAVAKDTAGNQSTASATIHVSNPPPVYGLHSGPPVFSWLDNGVDNKYQVNIALIPTFTQLVTTSATTQKKFMKATSWQPSQKRWADVLTAAALVPGTQATFYWRVVGKTSGTVMTKSFIIDKTM